MFISNPTRASWDRVCSRVCMYYSQLLDFVYVRISKYVITLFNHCVISFSMPFLIICFINDISRNFKYKWKLYSAKEKKYKIKMIIYTVHLKILQLNGKKEFQKIYTQRFKKCHSNVSNKTKVWCAIDYENLTKVNATACIV